MYKKLIAVAKKALLDGWSSHKLAQSGAIGFYIAFSPFPAGHTIIMLLFKYLFNLNFPLLFLTTSINNPFTAIPFFSCDYAFGYWLIHTFLELNPAWQLPLWPLYDGKSLCVWSFLIGGNILGIIALVVSYPMLLFIVKKVVSHHNHTVISP